MLLYTEVFVRNNLNLRGDMASGNAAIPDRERLAGLSAQCANVDCDKGCMGQRENDGPGEGEIPGHTAGDLA